MDPITDLLAGIRVESVCHGRLDATAPWGLRFQAAPHAKFSFVSQGTCWVQIEGLDSPVLLETGDFLLIAPDRGLTLRHDADSLLVDFDEVLRERLRSSLQIGGGGAPTTIICGKFGFSQPHAKPLIDALPTIIHLRGSEKRTQTLKTTLDLLVMEAGTDNSSSQLILNRLADVLFIQIIREFIESTHPARPVWLAAFADPQLGASLRRMHTELERPWTVADLAAEAGMSRSAYAQRFKQVVGEAPLEYVTRWRIYKACRLLDETDRKIVDVALAVGYDSDGAFHRAFKRIIGVAPGGFRRNPRQHPSTRPAADPATMEPLAAEAAIA